MDNPNTAADLLSAFKIPPAHTKHNCLALLYALGVDRRTARDALCYALKSGRLRSDTPPDKRRTPGETLDTMAFLRWLGTHPHLGRFLPRQVMRGKPVVFSVKSVVEMDGAGAHEDTKEGWETACRWYVTEYHEARAQMKSLQQENDRLAREVAKLQAENRELAAFKERKRKERQQAAKKAAVTKAIHKG